MQYRIDNEGKLHEIGDLIGRVGMARPARYDSFSIGYALSGFFSGGLVGLAVCILIKIIIMVYTLDTAFDSASLGLLAGQVFTPDFIFTIPVIITTIVFAVAGFISDGLEATGETFLISFGSLGFLFGGCIGVFLSILILAVCSALDSVSEFTMTRILATTLSACAGIGFFWNGFEASRDLFSVHRSFVGILCGLLRGILTCIALIFTNGCLVIILAFVFSPLVVLAAALIILFYCFKGFFILGTGGEWDDL